MDYAKLNQVPYREDQSNHSVKYDRNFLRNNVLTPIYKRFGKAENRNNTIHTIYQKRQYPFRRVSNEKLERHIKYDNKNIKINYDKSINPQCYIYYLKEFGFNHDLLKVGVKPQTVREDHGR